MRNIAILILIMCSCTVDRSYDNLSAGGDAKEASCSWANATGHYRAKYDKVSGDCGKSEDIVVHLINGTNHLMYSPNCTIVYHWLSDNNCTVEYKTKCPAGYTVTGKFEYLDSGRRLSGVELIEVHDKSDQLLCSVLYSVTYTR